MNLCPSTITKITDESFSFNNDTSVTPSSTTTKSVDVAKSTKTKQMLEDQSYVSDKDSMYHSVKQARRRTLRTKARKTSTQSTSYSNKKQSELEGKPSFLE